MRVAEGFLAGERGVRPGEQRAEVLVHPELDRLRAAAPRTSDDHDGVAHRVDANGDDATAAMALTARLEDGAHVAAESLRRIACDCAVRAVAVDAEGSPLDVGRRTRVVPRRLRTALLARDRCCRFPGCAHTAWLDAHHVEHWLHGGATDLASLVLLCPAHHRAVHEEGLRLELEGDRAVLRTRDGRPIPTTWEPPHVPGDILAVLRDAAESPRGDETLLPWWDGAPPDLRACVVAGRSRVSERACAPASASGPGDAVGWSVHTRARWPGSEARGRRGRRRRSICCRCRR